MEKIIRLDEKTIEKIKENKLIYSIIKFEKSDQSIKEKLYNRYMETVYIHEGNLSEDMYEDTEKYLIEMMEKVKAIRDLNQPVINQIVNETVRDISKIFSDYDDDDLRCARIFQYVTKSIKYADDYLTYDVKIPFADDFEFACYNGIPMGKNYIDTLVTKEGTSLEICTLMQALGNKFGINVKSIPVMKDGGIYYINSYNNDTSYLDPTAAIKNNGEDGSLFITKQDLLDKSIMIDTQNETRPEGKRLDVKINSASNVEKAISRERTTLDSKIITVSEEELDILINNNESIKAK